MFICVPLSRDIPILLQFPCHGQHACTPSCNRRASRYRSIVGNFLVFVTDTESVRKVLTENGPGGFSMVLHPSGRRILGPNNIAFMHGPQHKALRHSFLPLFSRKALGVYLHLQEELIRTHMDKWQRTVAGHRVEMRNLLRDLNQETSQTVFVGPYLDDPSSFSKWYTAITDGFLAFPAYFPGTTLWRAVRSREKVVQVLTEAARRSKIAMSQGVCVCVCVLVCVCVWWWGGGVWARR